MAKPTQLNSSDHTEATSYPWLAEYPKGVDWHAELPEKPVFAILDEAAEHYGDRPFLNFLGAKCRYGDAHAIVEKLAGAFQRMGVRRGVKVGLLLPNCPNFVHCFFAILKAGGTVVPYNPLLAPMEIARQVEDSETEIMVTLDLKRVYGKVDGVSSADGLRKLVVCRFGRMLPLAKRILFTLLKMGERITIPRDDVHVPYERLLRNPGKFERPQIDPRRDIAALIYTGGTTGTPKGVCLSHHNLYANAHQGALGLPFAERGNERVLAVLPFFHSFGLTAVLNTSIALGAEILLLPSFDPGETLRAMSGQRATMFMGVPAMFSAIADTPNADRHDLASLKLCTSGGDDLPMDVRRSFQRLADCDVVQGYGLTECSPIVTSGSPLGLDKPRSIGVPLPGTIVKIVSLEDGQTPVGPGAKGEICVKGPQVMMQYWNSPDATARALQDGWLHTGDVGYMDKDGYVYLVDRLKDVIITGGYNVYPSVVEAAIAEHPDVREVAVIGVPHSRWGQQVTAFVVTQSGRSLSKDQLQDFLKDRLSSYEMPKSIHFREELPKSMIGKVLKAELRATYEAARWDQQTSSAG